METVDMQESELNNDDQRGIGKETGTVQDLRWDTYIPMAVCVALVLWLYWPTFGWWYQQWMKKESYYSHGILIPPISLFIIWLQKKHLKAIPIRSEWLAYPLIVVCLFGTIMAVMADARSVMGLPFPLLIGGMVLLLLGRKMARQLAFPIGYLYFMCVLPSFLITMVSFRIQMMSTAGATLLLKALTFDVYREGAIIIMPNLPVYVGAACSGFRMSVTLLAIVALFLYVTEGPRWGRLGLLLSALPLAIVVNSIRIALVAIVGQFYGSGSMQFFHDNIAPYVEIIMAFGLLILIARLLKCLKFNSMLMS